MAAAAAEANLHLPCPEPPKWNPLPLLSLPMLLDSRIVAGSAVLEKLRELEPAAMATQREGATPCSFPVSR